MTKRIRSRIQVAEMSFLHRVAGRSLKDRVRSSVSWEELGVELRWLEHLFWMPPGCSWHVPPGRDPEEEPGHAGVTMSLSWPGNALGSSWKSWRKCPGRGKSGCPCSGNCPHDPAPDKRTKMDGWMDGWMFYVVFVCTVCSLGNVIFHFTVYCVYGWNDNKPILNLDVNWPLLKAAVLSYEKKVDLVRKCD